MIIVDDNSFPDKNQPDEPRRPSSVGYIGKYVPVTVDNRDTIPIKKIITFKILTIE